MRLLRINHGILVNFAPKRLELERYLYDDEKNEIFNMFGKPIGI